jgi:hypothetical protein
MGRVDGWNKSYVFISKVHYYIMGAHLWCTNYIDSFLLKLKILNRPNCAYKWFYSMLIHYTLQKIAMGHKKWPTITCIHLHKLFKRGVSTNNGASSPRVNNSSTCQICNYIDHVAIICFTIGDLKSKCGKCGDLPHRTKNYGVRCGYCIRMNHIEDRCWKKGKDVKPWVCNQ